MLILFLFICIPLAAITAFGAGLSLKESWPTTFSELPEDRQKFFTEAEVVSSLAAKKAIESYISKLDEEWVRARKNGESSVRLDSRMESFYYGNKDSFDLALKQHGYKMIVRDFVFPRLHIVPLHQTFWNS